MKRGKLIEGARVEVDGEVGDIWLIPDDEENIALIRLDGTHGRLRRVAFDRIKVIEEDEGEKKK